MEILKPRPKKCLLEKLWVQLMLQDNREEHLRGPWAQPLPQFYEPGTPVLLSGLSSPLSFVGICKWEATGHCLHSLQSKHQALSREWREWQSLLAGSQRHAAVQLKRWTSFPWAESRWLSYQEVTTSKQEVSYLPTFVHLCHAGAESVREKHQWAGVNVPSDFINPSGVMSLLGRLCTLWWAFLTWETGSSGLDFSSCACFLQSQLVSVLSEPSQEPCLPPLELVTSHMNDHKNILSHSCAWSLSPPHPKPQPYPELGNGGEALKHILLCASEKNSKESYFVESSKQSLFVGLSASEWHKIPLELSLKRDFISIPDMVAYDVHLLTNIP